jgi:hypothetical protein
MRSNAENQQQVFAFQTPSVEILQQTFPGRLTLCLAAQKSP